ncbi:MAG: SDR family NAD(P)-dependent oxidoreductase [Proteobacteria bacterium]|nr:SDR family NAD(P)-dependent oxidoreductase [Pseudomonadota bacterium]MCP4916628.1 SDR family NAD(P)-dependent oxidoreductase [Pseudomonadota bacterium]
MASHCCHARFTPEPRMLIVRLPAEAASLAPAVLAAGGIPLIDLTCSWTTDIPDGAWVRIHPDQEPPGTGPIVVTSRSRKVRGRSMWLELSAPGKVPKNFDGLLLRGREAGGVCGDRDGLAMLAECSGKVLLEAGCGPDTAAAAMALGAAGVVIAEQTWGLRELGLGPHLRRLVERAADTSTRVIAGFRVAASPMSPVVRRLAGGQDFREATAGWYEADDPVSVAVPAGQGLALAHPLAQRHSDLGQLIRAYQAAMDSWTTRTGTVTRWPDAAAPVGRTALALRASNGRSFVADSSGAVGSGVLWQIAAWEGLPITGEPLAGACAVGVPVLATEDVLGPIREPHAPEPVVEPPAPIPAAAPSTEPSRGEPIAIVGLGCVLPKAHDIPSYWDNITSGVSAIGEVPADRWEARLFHDADKGAPDKTYAKIGAFVRDFVFNSKKYRIPPKVSKQIDVVQQMTLEAVGQALEDAGIGPDSAVDRSRIAVILGNSMGGPSVRDATNRRVYYPHYRDAMEKVPEFQALPADLRESLLAAWEQKLKGDLLPITEDSMPGELSNVVAGRVANAFDLGGPNFTVDAACASSMAAVQAAVKGLQDGDFDLAVSGGSDRSMDPPTYTKFSKIGALSPDYSRPFDKTANGFVMGEGSGILLLKRLSDAERDGDRIYAVIQGFGGSSDGKGKGITAPNIQGQKRALRRAYADAGMDPVEVDLIECHGTSTVVGDKIEVEALSEVIGEGRRGARGPIRIGSVKSQIGHLKSAAGAAAMIKAALSLFHKTLPPSVGFSTPREDVPFHTVPLQVQTSAEPWQAEGWRRAAGVSAFGFGGTNFHAVLVEHAARSATPRAATTPTVEVLERPVPEGIWAVSAPDLQGLSRALDRVRRGEATAWNPTMPLRLAAAADSVEERADQVEKADKAIRKGRGFDLLRMRSIHLEDTPCDGKLAFLYTGQGSQYLGMGLDLAERFPVVKATFDEADAIMEPELGRPLRDYIAARVHDDEAESFEALRATEISQPATLTIDIAITRLLGNYGIFPDLVAGHSLGEYGALVAAGVLTFDDALRAVSARGREMAGLVIEDPGKMASIAASAEMVNEVLAEIPGYVVPANKNSPKQTVIAGASDAVEAACESFRSRGITVYPLPVSHAFHSAIVAPASKPLGKVLKRLGVKSPRRPVTTNVTSRWYPTDPAEIVDLLSRQVASPVEWVNQVERMYAEGTRVFVECGPKRALTGMISAILDSRPHRAMSTNHPKLGGERTFRDALAGMVAMGFPTEASPATSVPDLLQAPRPRLATSEALANVTTTENQPLTATPYVIDTVLGTIADRCGIPADELEPDMEFEADLGIDTVRQAEVVAELRTRFKFQREAGFLLSDHVSIRSLIDYFAGRLGQLEPQWDRSAPAVATQPRRPLAASAAPVAATSSPTVQGDAVQDFLMQVAERGLNGLDAGNFARSLMPAVQALLQASWNAFEAAKTPDPTPTVIEYATQPAATVRVVCSGASIGLPGGEHIFSDDNVHSILRGEQRITRIDAEYRERFLQKNLVRLVKDETGQGSFLPVESDDQVIQLAGRGGALDVVADYGVSASWNKALDKTTQLAFAAGLEALRDAGIPLVRTYKDTTTGKKVATGWALPEPLQASTGIVFASAFPGYDTMIDKLRNGGVDDEGHFDRRFLFQVLSMGHSQFAQFIGAKGPNTQVNSACASTTLAVGIAQDWIRLGRCDRVLVLGADDVTSDNMLEWIGAGFMAAGAATTHSVVEEAALPFDRRRHGMIIGMGAVGLLLERHEDAAARGTAPIAELLATRIANSAFHGSRLDQGHIANEVRLLVEEAAQREGVRPEEMGKRTMFMSHETYTPARGGSAGAEIAALRAAFGASADEVVISNTKGFTGHAMGASIEDAIAVKALQYRTVPPIPNLKEPDPELGNLRLSTGGHYDIDYCVRLAAGFGSQLALTVWKKVANGDQRVTDTARHTAWLTEVTGYADATLVRESGQLRALGTATAPKAAPPTPKKQAAKAGSSDVLKHLIGVVSEKTGYEPDEIEPDYELEADLGIDTVKQAEIFSEVRDHYGVERDDSFSLADFPTIQGLADWLASQIGAPAEPTISEPTLVEETLTAPERTLDSGATLDSVLDHLLGVISVKTGYDLEDLEPDYELEADLGIDTVKQAEIFSEVRDHYGVERDDSFNLADYATIQALAGWLASQAGASTEASPAAPAPIPTVDQPLVSEASISDGVLDYLLTVIGEKTGYERDDLELDYELEADLGIDTVKQAEIFSEVRDHFGVERDDGFNLADHGTIGALSEWLSQRVRTPARTAAPTPTRVTEEELEDPFSELPSSFWIRRPVRVSRPSMVEGSIRDRSIRILGEGPVADSLVAELARHGAFVAMEDTPYDGVIDVACDVFEAFGIAKTLVEVPVQDWICLTMMGEHEGMTPDQAFFDGSRCGFTKALNREWADCRARVVDVAPEVDPDSIARILCAELGAPDGAPEIFHGRDGGREVIELAVESHPPAGKRPDKNQVIIATGGGRGITARVALEWARRSPATLVLVGRSPAGETPLDVPAEKKRIKAELKAEGEKTSPAQVERRLTRLRKAEEIRVNMDEMRAVGSTVDYVTVDMADVLAVKALVADVIKRYGRVDGVIHGAGVEESRLIQDKDVSAFHRVFDGKALGGLALAESLPDGAWFLSMGSVAGRFGNEGQVDYSAANEALAQVCMARENAVHVDWTAWADVGMAVRGGMQSLLEARGVELMPAPAGAALAVDLIANNVTGEVVVAGKLGDFVPSPNHPKLDSIELDGDTVVARYRLDAERDGWIHDHAIDGKPVLPGVMGVELMVAAASLARARLHYTGLQDARFEKPVKLYGDDPVDLEVRAIPQPDGKVRCMLLSERTTRAGKTIRTQHFSATILVGESPDIAPLPPAFWPDDAISRGDIYKRFFHGDAFQVLRGADGVARDGLQCTGRVDHAYIAEGLLTSPLALEAAFQAAGLHAMVAEGVMALPSSIEALWMARRVRDGEDLTLTVQRREDSAYDVDVDGDDGRLLSLRGFRLIEKGPLPDGHRFSEPDEGWADTAFGTMTVVETGGVQACLRSAEVGESPDGWLQADELAELCSRGTEKRIGDRIAGRIAAKRALSALTGAPPLSIRIRALPTGQPVSEIDGQPGPGISISHSGGRAVALASATERVGVDLEQIEARHPSFVDEWFSAEERELLGEDTVRITTAWAAKEAILKALGRGMQLNPRQIDVRAIHEGEVEVVLRDDVAAEHAALGGGRIAVRVRIDGGAVLVEARIAA